MQAYQSTIQVGGVKLTNIALQINSSSLQRIENTNQRLENAMEEGSKLMQQIQEAVQKLGTGTESIPATASSGKGKHKVPELSLFKNDELNKTLMKNSQAKAESWSTIGIGEWINAGRWWLLKVSMYSIFPSGIR